MEFYVTLLNQVKKINCVNKTLPSYRHFNMRKDTLWRSVHRKLNLHPCEILSFASTDKKPCGWPGFFKVGITAAALVWHFYSQMGRRDTSYQETWTHSPALLNKSVPINPKGWKRSQVELILAFPLAWEKARKAMMRLYGFCFLPSYKRCILNPFC